MIENKRFSFESGHPMNGYFIYKNLTPEESTICYRLATKKGITGWNRQSLNAGHFSKQSVEILVDQGLVIRNNLLKISTELMNDPDNQERFRDLEDEYGLPCNIPKHCQNFFYDFLTAREVTQNPQSPESQEIRFQVDEPLFGYLNLLL